MKYLSILMVGVALATSGAADDLSKPRKWQSTSGHVLEAALVSFDSKVGTVRLKTTDGKEFDVQSNLLIHDDQELLKQWEKKKFEAANLFKRVDSAQKAVTNKTTVREVSTDKLEYRAKIWCLKGETEPFTGKAIDYREDGSKRSETPYVDGKRHGTEVDYNKDGSKWQETPYVNDQMHGTVISYSQDGSKRTETPHVNGKRHGTKFYYHRNGSKSHEIPYVDGKEHGTQILYRVDGSKAMETPYKHGKQHGTEIRYHEDGSKMAETPYENGKRHGTMTVYLKNGSKIAETVYENGKEISEKKF